MLKCVRKYETSRTRKSDKKIQERCLLHAQFTVQLCRRHPSKSIWPNNTTDEHCWQIYTTICWPYYLRSKTKNRKRFEKSRWWPDKSHHKCWTAWSLAIIFGWYRHVMTDLCIIRLLHSTMTNTWYEIILQHENTSMKPISYTKTIDFACDSEATLPCRIRPLTRRWSRLYERLSAIISSRSLA